MPPEFETYIEQVRPHIKWKKSWKLVEDDLIELLMFQYELAQEEGRSEKEGIREAMQSVGPPEMAAAEMNDAYYPKFAWDIIIPVILLLLLGVVLTVTQGATHIVQISVNTILCTAVFCIGLLVDCRWLEKHCRLAYLGYICLLALCIYLAILQYMSDTLLFHIALLFPIVFAGRIRHCAFGKTKGLVTCLCHMFLVEAFYLCIGAWYESTLIHVTGICMLAYAKEKDYFYNGKGKGGQLTILLAGTLIGFLPTLKARVPSSFSWDFSLFSVAVVCSIICYYIVANLRRINNGMGKIAVVGITTAFILSCTLSLIEIGADQAALPHFPLVRHDRIGWIYYFSFGILIGAIRDGKVIYDEARWNRKSE